MKLSQRAFIFLTSILLATCFLFPLVTKAEGTNQPTNNWEILQSIWRNVQSRGEYRFTADISQTSIPSAIPSNIGRSSTTDRYYLEGFTNLPDREMDLSFWMNGGSVALATDALEMRVRGDKAEGRYKGSEWEPVSNFTEMFAPENDALAFLVAAENIQGPYTVERQVPTAEGMKTVTLDAYSFEISGPKFAAYIREQMEYDMTLSGELRPGQRLELPYAYLHMTGTGELLVNQDQLPVSQEIQLNFPEMEESRIVADFMVHFSDFGELPEASTLPAFSLDYLAQTVTPADVQNTAITLIGILIFSAISVILVVYSQHRHVYEAVVLFVIFSMVVTPFLQVGSAYAHSARHSDPEQVAIEAKAEQAREQRDKLEQYREEQANHAAEMMSQDRLNQIRNGEIQPDSASSEAGEPLPTDSLLTDINEDGRINFYDVAAVTFDVKNPDDDDDGDGLTNYEEELLGTSSSTQDNDKNGVFDGVDSDNDLIPDLLEVTGITTSSGTFYLDPSEMDTNFDGLADGLECRDNNGTLVCPDTDGDGIPDAFSLDNDGDGVSDKIDLSPFEVLDQTFSGDVPFGLYMEGAQAGSTTYVEFQIRPTNPDHLWYAFNALDWPTDESGQIHDSDGGTFDDDSTGDMRLVPMLELVFPAADLQHLPNESLLTNYGISIRPLDESAQEYIVYIPLQLVSDSEQGDAKVAFYGKMLYAPVGLNWNSTHNYNFVWMVQFLSDQCSGFDKKGICEEYSVYNDSQIINTYDEEWQLTGLNIREDHGVDMAIVYEDPAIDENIHSDVPLMLLTHGLEQAYLNPRDCDALTSEGACIGDGDIDLTLDEIETRFHNPTNQNISQTKSWGLDDNFRVEQFSYNHVDEMLIHTTVTNTNRILNEHFTSHWEASNPLAPTLLFIREETFQSANLDGLATTTAVQTASGNRLLVFNLSAADAPLAMKVTSLNWAPYQFNSATQSWGSYDVAAYLGEILTPRLEAEPDLPEATDLQNDGAEYISLLYYYIMNRGLSNAVGVDFQGVEPDDLIEPFSTDEHITFNIVINIFAISTFKHFTGGILNLSKNETLYDFAGKAKQADAADNVDDATQSARNKSLDDIQYGMFDDIKNLKTILENADNQYSTLRRVTAVGNVALVIIAVIGLTLFIIGDITNNTPLAIAGGLMMAAFLVVYLVVQPLVVTVRAVQALSAATGVSRASATLSVLGSQSNLIGASKIGGAIGLAVSIGIIWGIFIYQVADGGYSPGSFEFNTLLAAAIAATIVAILLFIISTSVVGAIIVGILSFIDLLLFIICEAEDNDDCFTISGEITSWLAGHIYQYDTLIDLKEDDLITVGDFQTLFSEPNLGLIAGNELTMRLPVDIKIKNKATKDVGAASDRFYDGETIKKSAFTFSMTEEPEKIGATKNSMKNEWDVSKIGTAIYEITHGTIPPWKETRKITLRQAEASKIVDAEPVVLEAGMNQKYSFYFNTGVSLPAYECWVDECKSKTINQKIKGEDKLGPFFFDVFPADVETFYELAWISSRQQDHDGDDLISTDFGGPDPNDSVSGCPTGMCYDTDGDGLSDKYEINASAFGIGGFDAEKADTDGDGLTDLEELIHGSDPALRDTDGDGLTDSVEVSGWPFTYAQGKQVQAYSSPLLRDTDGDGLSDAAEKNLHETNLTAFPYHPAVFNENPIGFSGSLSGSGVYLPSTNFSYTATVKNTLVENIYADGTLDIRYPAQIISVDEQEQFSIPAGGAIEFVANKQINPSASSMTVEIENDIFAGLFQSQQAGEAYLGDSELLEKISVTIDNDPPSSDMTTVPFVIPGGIRIIGGVATDPTSYIDFVEVRIDGGPWQLATGAESWAYAWEVPVTSGSYTFEIRATDIVGNQQANPSQVTIEVDSTPPAASAAAEFDNNAFVFATRNVDGLWEIELDGSVTDNASGVRHLDVVVEPNGSGWLRADYNKNTDSWSAVYELSTSRSTDPFAVDASGQYTVSLRPVDLALNDGNSAVYTFPLRIDTTPPNVSLDSLKPINELGNIIEINTAPITQTTMLTGTITDPGDFAIGISEVEIAFTPYEVFQTLDQQALWVSFDEGTGSNTFRDQSISDKEGICLINRCPESGRLGRFGSAIQLTNTPAEQEDYVEVLDLDVSETAYSSALWFRTTCADCGLFSLDEKAELFAEHDRDIFLLGGNVCAEVGGAASPICSADANYADDQWHMAVQTIGADGGHLLYVDGQLAADGPETSSPNTIQDSVNIGYAPAANTPYLNGQIDEVRVFNQELTADEVRGLFQSWTAFAPVAPTLTSSEWQYQVPEGLEGNYQIDLTGSDQFNNRNDQRQSWQQWRGEIDTKVPDLEISVEYTGTRMTAQTIISGVAKDSNLSTDGYQFPCALEAADYHFDDEGQLVKLTPSCSLAGWQTEFNYLRACDRYGHCAAITPDLYHIYWTLGDGLFRAPLSGAATTKDDVQKLLVSDNDPQGLVLDIDGGKVYWAEGGLTSTSGGIKRANLDGSEIEQLVSGLPSLDQNSGHWRPDQRIGLAIDLGANQMYYGQANDGGIWRANLDGSGMSQIIDTLALNGANSRLSWIKLDQTNGNIYWLMGRNGSPWPLEVWMASLNDPQNSAQLIYSDSVDGQFLDGLEVVPADNKIYWTLTNAGEQGVIMQADLDGSNQSILHTGTNFSETNFGAITVEPFSRALYWRTGYVHYEASDNLYMATYPHFRQILQDGSDNQRVYPSTQLNNSRNCGSFCSFADLSIERDGNDLEIERIPGTIFTSTDLDIEIVGDSDLAFRNGQNSFEITARNLGPLDAHDVQVDLTLDNAYSVNQMIGCDLVNGASCLLGSLLEGETVTFTVVLDVSGSASDTLDLNAVVSASKPDHLPVNNQATFVAYYAPERGLPPAGSEKQIYVATELEDGTNVIHQAQGNEVTNFGQMTMIIPDAGTVTGLALDSTRRKIYWLDQDTDSIWSADLDGSNTAQLYSGLVDPQGLHISLDENWLYWADNGTSSNGIRGRIGRYNLNTNQLEILVENLNIRPIDLVLDQIRERLYWRNGSVIFGYDVHLDSEPAPITTINSQVNSIAIDGYSSRLYWAHNNYFGSINWVNLFDQSTGRRLEARTPSNVHYDLLDDELYYFYYNDCLDFNLTLASANAGAGSPSPVTFCRDWQPRHVAVLHLVPPPAPPVITSIPDAQVIVANEFSYQPAASGSQPISWALTQSPSGVTFDSVSGAVSFTPAIAGNYDFVLQASNTAGTVNQPFTVEAVNPAAPVISSIPIKIGEAGQPYSYTAEALGQGPISWALLSGPAGLTLSSNGLVEWANPITGVHSVEIQAGNLGGNTVQAYSLNIYSFNAAGQIYWINNGNQLQRTDPDVAGNIFPLNSVPTHKFNQLAIDNANQKLYWTAEETPLSAVPDNRIMSSDLDGGNLATIISTSDDVYGVAIDTIRSHIYWTNPTTNALLRADLDGGNMITASTNLTAPHAIEIDLTNERIYYVDNGDANGSGSLYSTNFDGSNSNTLLSGRQGLTDFDLELSAGAIYWGENDGADTTIFRGLLSLDGQSIEAASEWVGVGDVIADPFIGLVADPAQNRLYYTDSDNNFVGQRGVVATIADSGDGVSRPTDMATIYPANFDFPKPEIKILEPTSGSTATASAPITFTAVITAYASVDQFELQRVRGPGLFPEIISSGTFRVGEAITFTMQSAWMTDTLDTFEFQLQVWDHGVGISQETLTVTTESPPSDFVIPPGYTGPVIGEFLSPPNGSVYNTLDPITFSGHAGSAAYLESVILRDYDNSVFGEGWGDGETVTTTWETDWSNFRSPDPNGEYIFEYEIRDYDGNSKVVTHMIIIDLPPSNSVPPGFTPPTAGMRIDVPADGTILTTLDPVVISGTASSEAFINMFNVNTTGFNNDFGSFADGAFLEQGWQTTWTPTADGVYQINASVLDHDGVTTNAMPVTVTVATTPPTIQIAPTTLTGAQQLTPLYVELAGTVSGFGLAKVEVSIDGSDWILAELDGSVWRFAWPAADDSVTYNVSARVTDGVGRIGLDDKAVLVDVQPPAAVDIALFNDFGGSDLPLSEGDTVHQPTAELVMTWPASTDGGGIGQYFAGWTTDPVFNLVDLTAYNSSTFRHSQIVPDHEIYYAHFAIEDTYGNIVAQTLGPIYVDGPLTPNLIDDLDYRGWLESPSAQIGADRELSRRVNSSATVSDIQRMYLTWDNSALRLAWTGANWNRFGDLFIYFDTANGGSTTAFNPYGDGTSIGLPIDEGDQLAADYLLFIEDDQTVELYSWSGTAWVLDQMLPSDQYRFETDEVDIRLPFAQIGAIQNGPLKMVALASEEDSLEIWAAIPDQNPLNSVDVVAADAKERTFDSFELTQLQSWPALSSNVTPNLDRFADQGLIVEITVDVGGSSAGFLAQDLFDLLTPSSRLDANLDGELDLALPANSESPLFGNGDSIIYTISYSNDGSETAEDVTVSAEAFGGLEFGNQSTAQINLGNIPAGGGGSVTLEGKINSALNGQSAEVVFVLSDNIHDDFEWVWFQHSIDSEAPFALDRQTPAKYVRAGIQTISGVVRDNHAVDFVELQIREQPTGIVTNLVCPDGNNDGVWDCIWDAGSLENTNTIEIRVKAVDLAGNQSEYTAWESLIVDLSPPQIALNASSLNAIADGIITDDELLFSGNASDDNEVVRAEICFESVELLNQSCTLIPVSPGNTAAGTWRFDGTNILSGDNDTQTLTLYAFDGAGNRSAPVEYSYQIDTIGPVIQVTESNLFIKDNSADPVLAGGVFDNGTVDTLTVRAKKSNGEVSWIPLSFSSKGLWQFAETLTDPGEYQLILEATDSVGNSTASGPYLLTIIPSTYTMYLPIVGKKSTHTLD